MPELEPNIYRNFKEYSIIMFVTLKLHSTKSLNKLKHLENVERVDVSSCKPRTFKKIMKRTETCKHVFSCGLFLADIHRLT
jgi:hypothetical protein